MKKWKVKNKKKSKNKYALLKELREKQEELEGKLKSYEDQLNESNDIIKELRSTINWYKDIEDVEFFGKGK